VLDINLPAEEQMVFTKFRELIRTVKGKSMLAIKQKNKLNYQNAKEEHYKTLLMKDIWLRKIMMERGLYLKEYSFDASQALWGG